MLSVKGDRRDKFKNSSYKNWCIDRWSRIIPCGHVHTSLNWLVGYKSQIDDVKLTNVTSKKIWLEMLRWPQSTLYGTGIFINNPTFSTCFSIQSACDLVPDVSPVFIAFVHTKLYNFVIYLHQRSMSPAFNSLTSL